MSAIAPEKRRPTVPHFRHSRDSGNPVPFARYPKYKDSGVEWLGEVPAHWEVARIKASVASCRNGIWGSEESGDDNDIPCVRVADFDRNRLVVDQVPPTIRNVSAREREGRLLNDGNLLLEKSGGGEGQPVGCIVLYDCDAAAVCSNFVARMELRSGMAPSFWRYVHAAAYSVRLTTRSINQTSGIQNLDQDRYFNERVAFPSAEEQSSIAAFLDRATAKIDALIAEQEKLIALLKEKRQALISHAVTKGLDPNAPMKDSDIEWLGQVPAHWVLGGLTKFIGPVADYRGRTPTKLDEGTFLVTAKNIRNGTIDYAASEEFVDPEEAAALLARGAPEIGDVLFTTEAPLGQVAQIDRADFALAQRIVKFRGVPDVIINRYLMYWLMGSVCQSRLETLATGSTALGIKASKLGMIECLVPPLDEQRAIVDHIDDGLRGLAALQAEAERAIELLKERRAALVSAAVTGKIDVRGIAVTLGSPHGEHSRRQIRWAEPRQPCEDWDCEPDAVVWVSVEKLNATWQHDDDDYIGVGGAGAAIEDRYARFGQWLLDSDDPVELPVIGIDDNGSVGFTDGRHRFAWLRDHGVHSMPVQVPADQAVEIESRFGTIDRTSFMPA